jgi:hypothetical protein
MVFRVLIPPMKIPRVTIQFRSVGYRSFLLSTLLHAANDRSGRRRAEGRRQFPQFAGSETANRLVLTVGKFAVVDMFDTNRYANNPKADLLNWGSVNTSTFDYAGDAWGYTYGAAAEWYQGDWTLRGGVFDMPAVPAESADSGPAYGLDPTFDQFQMVGEIERRYALFGEPGTIKVTGFLTRGRMANFADALALSQTTGLDINDATAASRVYQSRPGVSVNLAQQLTEDVGVFARAGWVDGDVESWDFTDTNRTIEAGASINGKHGIGRTIRSAFSACRTASTRLTQHGSMPVAWASSSATGNCRIPPSNKSSRLIITTLCPPPRGFPSTTSSSTIPASTPTEDRRISSSHGFTGSSRGYDRDVVFEILATNCSKSSTTRCDQFQTPLQVMREIKKCMSR